MKKVTTNEQSSMLLLFLIAAVILSFVMNFFLTPEFIVWFIETHKSPLAPDPGVFRVMSTVLLWLFAVSGWIVWCKGKLTMDSDELKMYLLVLFLMILSVSFTAGIRAAEVSLVLLAILWVTCLMAMRSFSKVDKVAGLIMFIILLWTTFEAYLYLVVLI